jgi:hypothetical protein
MCRLFWNPGASTSWNPQGLYRPVMELLYLYFHLHKYPSFYLILSHLNLVDPFYAHFCVIRFNIILSYDCTSRYRKHFTYFRFCMWAIPMCTFVLACNSCWVLCEKLLLASSCLSVCLSIRPSEWISSAPNGRILMKSYTWVFFEKKKLSKKFKFH